MASAEHEDRTWTRELVTTRKREIWLAQRRELLQRRKTLHWRAEGTRHPELNDVQRTELEALWTEEIPESVQAHARQLIEQQENVWQTVAPTVLAQGPPPARLYLALLAPYRQSGD